MTKLVIVESPYAGDIAKNVEYAKQCCLDAINEHGEAPFASHLLYPQFLDDGAEADRSCGIQCGYDWGLAVACSTTDLFSKVRIKVAFYVDHGWSPGMERALETYTDAGLSCEIRRLEK